MYMFCDYNACVLWMLLTGCPFCNFKLNIWWSKFLIMKNMRKCRQERDLNLQNWWIFWMWKKYCIHFVWETSVTHPGDWENSRNLEGSSSVRHFFIYWLTSPRSLQHFLSRSYVCQKVDVEVVILNAPIVISIEFFSSYQCIVAQTGHEN